MPRYTIYNFLPAEQRDRYVSSGSQAARDAAALIVTRDRPDIHRLTDYTGLESDSEASDHGDTVILGGYTIKNVTVSCNQSKHIVSTAINGVNGTIKEWVSDGDVVIMLTVYVLSTDSNYPEQQVRDLMDIVRKNERLEIVNSHINNVWDVQQVVVTGCTMSGKKERNMEEINISLLSDEEYAIEQDLIG